MSLPRLNRPQRLAFWQIDSATPVEVDTDLYWTAVEMQRLNDLIKQLASARRTATGERLLALTAQQAAVNEEWETLNEHSTALQVEYSHRRWNRVYLVTSSDGHIHSGPYCTTFQARTTCTLLPQVSGWPQEQIINAAGEKACTKCFPDAPVAHLLPCTLFDPQSEQERAAKVAEKAAKARVCRDQGHHHPRRPAALHGHHEGQWWLP